MNDTIVCIFMYVGERDHSNMRERNLCVGWFRLNNHRAYYVGVLSLN